MNVFLSLFTVIATLMVAAGAVIIFSVMGLNVQRQVKNLELTCCFCDYEIHKSNVIKVGEFYLCDSCGSEIEALAPSIGSKSCKIGRWKSYYA